MTPLRKAIEQVLQKHEVFSKDCHGHSSSKFVDEWVTALVDDLLSCWPTPSREALEKLLMSWESRIIWNTDFQKGKSVIPERLDELMVWATGTTRKVWCEHIRWQVQTATMAYEGVLGGWIISRGDSLPYRAENNWIVCPLCATPRPI